MHLQIYFFLYYSILQLKGASQVALVVKNPHDNAGARDTGLIPGLGRCSGGGHGNPLQWAEESHHVLKNPMEIGAWQAMVHMVTKSWT